MTDNERKELAREGAKQVVARLRASNERAAKNGGPRVDDAQYSRLQQVLTRKLQRG